MAGAGTVPEHTYVDFDLLIEPAEDHAYRARVLNSPVGETRPMTVRMPFSDLELENFLLKVGRPRRQDTRGEATPEASAVRDFGGRLFDAVFRDEVRTALTSSIDQVEAQEDTGLRLRLRLSDCPELAELPWEYLYDRDTRRFLALSQWTPVVRYLEMSNPIRPLRVAPPLRILMMAASPTDFPALDVVDEWNKTREALQGLLTSGRVELDRVPTGTLAALRDKLRDGEYHVFHFIGHGRYDPNTQDGVVALEGPEGRAQLVSGADLGALLHDERSLRLALLNSCEGARGGLGDPYSGTAQSLVYQGIPAVVAMQFEITDSAAITFARSLYEAVAAGYPLDAAMGEARNAIREQPNPVEWATPVLYLRAPDGRIFDVPATAQAAPPVRPEPEPTSTPPPPPPPPPPPDQTRPIEQAPPPGRHHAQVDTGTPPRRGVLVAAGVAAVAIVAAGVVWAVTQLGGGSSPASSSSSVTTVSGAAVGLPQGAALPPATVIVPLAVNGNTDLYLVDSAAGGDARPLVAAAGKDLAPVIAPDRRSVIYAHEVGGAAGYELHVVATDGTGDRPLFDGTVEGCAAPMRPGWSAHDPGEIVVPCYAYQGADRAELRILTLRGKTVRVLSAGVARMDDVSFSPDGSRVVYWGADDAQSGDGQLYSVAADGSGSPRQLTTTAGNADAVFSPDGTQIAFRRTAPGGAQIWVMDADGSGARALTAPGSLDQDPSWSPDGSEIAFKSNRPGPLPGTQCWVMNSQGQNLRQLGHTVGGEADNAVAWGPR